MMENSAITAVIIAKDEQELIGRCIRSLTGVDEVVVLDTGSVDRTPKVCEQLGARVFRMELISPFHFADARNRALKEVRTTWAISIDADEVMRPGWHRKLRKAITDRPDLGGFLVTFIDRVPGRTKTFARPKMRIFRADAWYWQFRIHEELTQKDLSNGPLSVGDLTDSVFMEHLPDPKKSRRNRNVELLELCVKETPQHFRAFRKLGQEYMLAKRWSDAVFCLSRYLECAESDGPLEMSEAMSERGRALAELGRIDEAIESFTQAVRICPNRREPAFYAALALIKACRLEEALTWITRMEAVSPKKKPGSPYDLATIWTDEEPKRMRRFCEAEITRAKASWSVLHGS